MLGCAGSVGDRGSRRAKAEALKIMYFHVVDCLWLLGWFGDVLSCLGSMVLCRFALESFSRCCRSTLELASSNTFAAVGHGRDLSGSFATVGHGFALSNSFGAFRFQLLRFPSFALQRWFPSLALPQVPGEYGHTEQSRLPRSEAGHCLLQGEKISL